MIINNQVVILAGGFGTRLSSRSGNIPKSMVLVLGKPLLEHQLLLCKKYGFTKIALLVHYQAHLISEYFGDGSNFGVELTYIIETEAKGTGGALLDALNFLANRFLVLYGDTYIDVDLGKLWEFDSLIKSSGTLFVHPNNHPDDSDLVDVCDEGFVIGIHPYPHAPDLRLPNLVNAALYVLENESIGRVNITRPKPDLAKHIFPAMLANGCKLRAYISPEYIKDMGTPERLDRVELDVLNGVPRRLSSEGLRPAVFFDRDGTLNEEAHHLHSPDQLKLIKGVGESIKRLNQFGILAVGITNQPVIARGDVNLVQMKLINAKLDSLLGQEGAYLDRLYICPHHPEKGFAGEVLSLKIRCHCRKPEGGLIDQAVRELNISRCDSWMIGDATSDILCGSRAGVRTILVRTGYAGRDYKYHAEPSFIADSVKEAVDWIIEGHAAAIQRLMPVALEAKDERVILIGGASRTGKSTAANIMVELFKLMGKKAHILSLDCWLKKSCDRVEGFGVMTRYDMSGATKAILDIAKCGHWDSVVIPQFDRKTREALPSRVVHIGPDDILLIEGVPALMHEKLLKNSRVRIYVSVEDKIRLERVMIEYKWRGEEEKFIHKKINSREADEVVEVKRSASNANFFIQL